MPLTIDIVIPVYNEEQDLPRSILILTDFLKTNVINPWQIVIADNASTDSTRSVSEMLCERYPGVNYLYLPQKGRGRALKAAWMDSTADRVVSVHLSGRAAGDKAAGSVLASDAFFPFPDNIELAAQAGVTAIVQPGGSIRDAEVIEEANKNNLAMVFTGVRHFRH